VGQLGMQQVEGGVADTCARKETEDRTRHPASARADKWVKRQEEVAGTYLDCPRILDA